MNQHHEAIRSAYADLLAAADAAYNAADPRNTLALRQTTELIDLLETAVAQAIDNMAAERPVGHG